MGVGIPQKRQSLEVHHDPSVHSLPSLPPCPAANKIQRLINQCILEYPNMAIHDIHIQWCPCPYLINHSTYIYIYHISYIYIYIHIHTHYSTFPDVHSHGAMSGNLRQVPWIWTIERMLELKTSKTQLERMERKQTCIYNSFCRYVWDHSRTKVHGEVVGKMSIVPTTASPVEGRFGGPRIERTVIVSRKPTWVLFSHTHTHTMFACNVSFVIITNFSFAFMYIMFLTSFSKTMCLKDININLTD